MAHRTFNRDLTIFGIFMYLGIIYFISVLIFTKGFLLKRDVITTNSSCRVDFAQYWDGESHGAEGCWLHRRFDKAVIILIDALRFDFLEPVSPGQEKPYINKLQTVHTLLENKPYNSRLYKFIADPPTTTLQRLKGLTTGTLPTFVDVGTNFASSEINEDNFIDQLVAHLRKLTFLGDDTWSSLFPHRFHREFSFPSFNVKDLHTVDNGILENLYTEIKRKDWDVLIAHFLGVDHCGHRYGPNHHAMADKLKQMDQMLRNVTTMLDSKTILFLLGDHGMTQTGDHGGDSQDELEAGLFVYSPDQITSSKHVKHEYLTVSQIDLVPTVSLLLGVPIPFSNLGCVIKDLLNYCPWSKESHIKQVYHSVEALRLNAQQIGLFVREYSKISSDLPLHKLTLLQEHLHRLEEKLQHLVTDMFIHNDAHNAHEMLHYLENEYTLYIQQVKELCREVWAKFDLTCICLGLMLLVVCILVNIYVTYVSETIAENKDTGTLIIVMVSSAVFVVYSFVQTFYLEGQAVSIMSFLLGAFNIVALVIIIHLVCKSTSADGTNRHLLTFENCVSSTIIFFTCVVYFSNSFVVYEDRIYLFLSQTLIWYFSARTVMSLLKNQKFSKDHFKVKSKGNRKHELLTHASLPIFIFVSVTCLCSAVVRLSTNFHLAREEQVNSSISTFLEPLSSIGDTVEGNQSVRYFFCAGCLFLSIYLFRKWLQDSGNLNGLNAIVVCARYILPVGGVMTALHWAIQALPAKVQDSLPIWQQVVFADAAYIIIVISFVAVVISPLSIYCIPKQRKQLSITADSGRSDLIRKVYEFMKGSWQISADTENSDSEVMRVYGLGTVFTSAIVYVGLVVLMLLSLLLGDGLAPSLLTSVLVMYSFLELYSISVKTCRDTDLLITGLVIWNTFTSTYFFGFGHQTTIPAIRFDAAFVGFHGDWNNKLLPAILIHFNMFASEVLFTILAPLLLLWPYTKGLISAVVLGKKVDAECAWTGDFVVHENAVLFRQLLVRLLSSLFLINGLKTLASMLAATLHRRHLMVWKIFAPRFVYQSMSSFTVFIVSLLMLALFFRVDATLRKWTEKFNQSKSQ